MSGARQGLRLGIDAGGTFTDAVLVDAADSVVASAKSLTTRFDLSEGIGKALDALPRERLAEVSLVCLSTTLTTNSVVEGKGAPVGALLAGYDLAQVRASGLAELLGHDVVVALPGGHDEAGRPLCALDEDAAREAILRLAPRVAAFAISASFGVRNPEHELRLRELVHSLCERPVTCGHELTANLGAPRRALTAALNARMIPYVTGLIAAVRATLVRHGIAAPLMMVRGDGSLTSAESAVAVPVTTVLSGPAASVIGACALSGRRDGVVADMGGTTTDIAVVRDGRPELAFDGASIGGWQPMVEAVRVYAIGIGGDSEVRFGGSGGVVVGPRRVVPLSLLGHQHPELIEVLEQQLRETVVVPSHGRFALRFQSDAALLADLSDAETAAWERLGEGPVDMQRAGAEDRSLARAIARLERKGLAIYTGFTPTDAAHVLGMSRHWDTHAARLGARLWSRHMRRIHGLGRWEEDDEEGPARKVFDCVVEAICHKLIEAGLNDAGRMSGPNAARLSKLLSTMVLGHGAGTPQRPSVFEIRFDDALPLVAVGAPAESWYPAVAKTLRTALAVPRHGDVANAMGAVLGEVAQRVHLTVTQPVQGVFRVFAHDGPRDFPTLEDAYDCARDCAGEEALELARHAGASDPQLRTDIHETSAEDDNGTRIFFEARVTATASGPPLLRG